MWFEVSPEYRGKGVATALLGRVVRDAQAEGCNGIEGYPHLQKNREIYDFVGPIRLYEKCGFFKEAQQDNIILMRKVLDWNYMKRDRLRSINSFIYFKGLS